MEKSQVKTDIKVAKLHPDKIERYEQLHRDIPYGNVKHMQEGGMVSLRIFREGLTLFMIVEKDPSLEISDRVIDHALNEEWRLLTGECFSKFWQDAAEIYRFTRV